MDEKSKKELLESTIKEKIKNLKNMSPDSDGYSAEVDAVAKLYKINIEETESEKAFQTKQMQISDDRKALYWDIGIKIGNIVVPMLFYGVWMKRGFKFEENGVYTSTTFKNFFSKLKPH